MQPKFQPVLKIVSTVRNETANCNRKNETATILKSVTILLECMRPLTVK